MVNGMESVLDKLPREGLVNVAPLDRLVVAEQFRAYTFSPLRLCKCESSSKMCTCIK